MAKKRYWMCIIGPTDQGALPRGANTSMRMAVRECFEEVTGKEDQKCWSGWGLTEERMEEVQAVWNKD